MPAQELRLRSVEVHTCIGRETYEDCRFGTRGWYRRITDVLVGVVSILESGSEDGID
jgi:hypothetical protein